VHGALYAAFQLGLWTVGQDDDRENRGGSPPTERYRRALLAFAGEARVEPRSLAPFPRTLEIVMDALLAEPETAVRTAARDDAGGGDHRTGTGRIASAPLPEPGPGQVRVKLEGCGVCASNLTPWAGPDWMRFPDRAGRPGARGLGRRRRGGGGRRDLAEGDRVAALSYRSYAEYDLVDAAAAVKLPPRWRASPSRASRWAAR
jgi:hypothetical protein